MNAEKLYFLRGTTGGKPRLSTAFGGREKGSKAWLHDEVEGEARTMEVRRREWAKPQSGIVRHGNACKFSGSSCDDSSNPIEEDVEDFEVVKRDEVV
ncbi:hypothetical protein DVH24_002687 [Malus domestica]|uniref:Uncharacterized protein n=1 Tax=Malus domestica TaxID=3750 RepID=A0A498K348_MALDO|nr:hypothetical protein DVH24_002687 [Malus domestica]